MKRSLQERQMLRERLKLLARMIFRRPEEHSLRCIADETALLVYLDALLESRQIEPNKIQDAKQSQNRLLDVALQSAWARWDEKPAAAWLDWQSSSWKQGCTKCPCGIRALDCPYHTSLKVRWGLY
jgi:hypothetical protein